MNTGVYIEIPKYKQVLDAIDIIKSRLVVAKKLLRELHTIRAQENKHVQIVTDRLEDMEKVIVHVDEEVFG